MPSIHRLSTRIDHVEESEWNASFAHKDDTVQAGSSCLLGAEKRLVDQEAMVLLGLDVLVLLWDAAKFYDHIEYENLVGQCNKLEYGPTRTAYTLAMHAAPRIMKIGNSVGLCTASMGCSIVAGCN